MPRFMSFVRFEPNADLNMPPEMGQAMNELITKEAASGTFVDGGGLFGTEDARAAAVGRNPTLDDAFGRE